MGFYGPGDDDGQDDLKGSEYKAGIQQGIQGVTSTTGKYGAQVQKFYSQVLAPFFQAGKAESDAYGAAAQATQRDIFNLLGEGFGNARTNIAAQGRVGMQGIQDAQTQALGASNQAAISAGLSGSTAQGNANRGIASDTARSIAGLQASLGQLYAGLDVGQAQAQGQALQGLAGIQQNQQSMAQNFLGLQLSGLNQTPIQPKSDSGLGSILGGLLGGVGSFLGAKSAAGGY